MTIMRLIALTALIFMQILNIISMFNYTQEKTSYSPFQYIPYNNIM